VNNYEKQFKILKSFSVKKLFTYIKKYRVNTVWERKYQNKENKNFVYSILFNATANSDFVLITPER
jgi:hypothetical protein